MSNIFSSGEDMLEEAFDYAAVSIDYIRGEVTYATDISAKLGKTLFQTNNNYGISMRSEQRDFIIRCSDLSITPEVGDEIHYDSKKYMITSPEDEPCWAWHTRLTHSQIRIHSKYLGEVEDV